MLTLHGGQVLADSLVRDVPAGMTTHHVFQIGALRLELDVARIPR